MRTLTTLIFCLMPVAACADCLKVDSIIIDNSPKLAIPVFVVKAHNECQTVKPNDPSKLFSLQVAFYDKDDARISLGSFCVGRLDAGEKISHRFDVPFDARKSGVPVTVKVKSITEGNLCF